MIFRRECGFEGISQFFFAKKREQLSLTVVGNQENTRGFESHFFVLHGWLRVWVLKQDFFFFLKIHVFLSCPLLIVGNRGNTFFFLVCKIGIMLTSPRDVMRVLKTFCRPDTELAFSK